MADARNALTANDAHIWTLRVALLVMAGLLGFAVFVIYQKQNEFTCHVPPDLSQGAMIKPGELQQPNSYAFAMNIWRGLNDWPDNGVTDYRKNIDEAKCYVTPAFYEWLNQNYEQKDNDGELKKRTRTVTSSLQYHPQLVRPLGNNTFATTLLLRIQDRVPGAVTPIKDITLKYNLRVVPDNRQCNAMGMALDGFADDASRIAADKEGK